MSYKIPFTNSSKTPITVDAAQIDDSTGVTLFGRTRLAYGQELQENLLHILENFSCPEDPYNQGNPNLSIAESGKLNNPVEGQCWYNSTKNVLTYYDGVHWIPLARQDGIAANWGMIYDGGFLPNPISAISGRIFDYSECVWIVSPQSIPNKIDYYVCNVNSNGQVSMKYRNVGSNDLISGIANFLIVGIEGNVNQVAPPINPTPTPTPTPTTSFGASPTPQPTITPTQTPVSSPTPTQTPSPSVSSTPQPSVAASPVPSSTPHPSITPSPSPVPATLPFNNQSYRQTVQTVSGHTSGGDVVFGMNTSGWYVFGNPSATVYASGPIPSNAYSVQYIPNYRPDLGTLGGSPYNGTMANGAPTITPISTSIGLNGTNVANAGKIITGSGQGNWETCITVQVLIYDINGNVIVNSTCVLDSLVKGY